MHYACYNTRTQAFIIFCHVHYCSQILLTVFNFDVVLYRIGIKLIRMLRRCIIKVYVLSI